MHKMRTVKEISELTGISVRTLHYYDEIGLLAPTDKSGAGYRLYDDKALETLQQILYFREFDIPLKEIKLIMDSPSLDRNRILKMQRKMLAAKKERMERLIASIDDILKGENEMDFAVFNRTEIEELCQAALEHMPDFLQQSIVEEFGGIEQWKKHYADRASKEDMQKGYQKLVEWYGGKEEALRSMTHPPKKEVVQEYESRVNRILDKLIAQKDRPLDSPEIKEIIEEYGAATGQFLQMKHEEGAMLATASSYRDARIKQTLNQKYGEGAAEFFARAIEAFYKAE